MKKQIITISGLPGSGKSSTASEVARRLGLNHFSSGRLFREIAERRKISLEKANRVAEDDKDIDAEVDGFVSKLGAEKDNFVIDSRTAFHLIPDSFRVFLYLDPEIASRRIYAQIQKEGRYNQTGSSLDEIFKNTVERTESEKKRYRNLFGVDFIDKSNYDLYIDTAENDMNRVADIICGEYEKWLSG